MFVKFEISNSFPLVFSILLSSCVGHVTHKTPHSNSNHRLKNFKWFRGRGVWKLIRRVNCLFWDWKYCTWKSNYVWYIPSIYMYRLFGFPSAFISFNCFFFGEGTNIWLLWRKKFIQIVLNSTKRFCIPLVSMRF